MLRRFMGSARHYLSHVPDRDDLVEWLALMQHHGAQTRLLDFTYSFAVAAFFAARNAKFDFAIWGFNWRQLRLSVCAYLCLPDFIRDSSFEFQATMHNTANSFLLHGASGAPLVFPVDPIRQNERRATQQGLFLFPSDSARTFLENLACLYPDCGIENLDDESLIENYESTQLTPLDVSELSELKVVKFVLPRAERFKTLNDLDRLNIHDGSLFPGIDGFARSLSRYTLQPS